MMSAGLFHGGQQNPGATPIVSCFGRASDLTGSRGIECPTPSQLLELVT